MTKRTRSICWDYFKKEEEYAVCLVGSCTAKVKHSGNTSNLMKHLHSCHIEEHKKCLEEQEKNKKKVSTSTSTQITLAESLSSTRKYPKDSAKCKKLDNALVEMITTDMQPLSIVQDSGFKKYTSILDPRYELPSRRTITRTMLPKKYTDIKQMLQEKLKKLTSIALTTDIWSSRQGLSYCCLTAHAIADNWTLESYVLETFNFNTEHTGLHISTELSRIVNDWGSPEISCCVTDNASNMNCGIELTGWNHLPCFAHTLNLVQDSLGAEPGLSVIKEKCKAIVAHFHRSTKSSEKLRSTQQQLNMPELKLIQDVVTRWNSTYLMFERILSQHEAVTTTLCLSGKAAMCLSTEEKESISEALVLLKPFLQATEEISGDKYISISIIIPLTKMLLKATSNGPNVPLRPLLVQELMRRFSQVEQRYTMAVSTLLDPRFKKLAFADSAAVDQAIRRLKSEVIELMSAVPANEELTSDDGTHGSTQLASGPPPTEDSLWASFDRKVCQATSHRTDSTDSFIEVKRYFEAKVIARKDDPLLWWKENGHQFPHVTKIAKQYLAIPGSSVPSERLFSKAGELISQRRSQLKPKNVDMILFLNKNLPLFINV